MATTGGIAAPVKRKTKAQLKKEADARKKARTKRLQTRDRDLVRQYTRKLNPLHLDRLRWRFVAVRLDRARQEQRVMDVSSMVQSASWAEAEDQPGLTGQLTLARGEPAQGNKLDFGDGHVVICSVWWGGRWREVWRMRIWKPDEDVKTRVATFDLADDMRLLAVGSDDFEYKKGKKKRPHGWAAYEIVQDLSKKYGFRVGYLPRTRRHIKNLSMSGKAPLDVIKKAYELERSETGRRYVLRWVNGRLSVLPLRRQQALTVLEDLIQEATISHERDPAKFYTAVRATGSYDNGTGRGKKKKKFDFVVRHEAAIRRYGYIVRKRKVEDVDDRAAAIRKVKRDFAEMLAKQTQPTFTVTHQGVPWIRRGDALQVIIREYGITPGARRADEFKTRQSIMFVSAITYSLEAGAFTMEPSLTVDDPVAKYHDELRTLADKKKREAAKRKRKKK